MDKKRIYLPDMEKINKKKMANVAVYLAVLVIIAVFIIKTIGIAYIPSESMYPTLKTGDRVVVNKSAYKKNEPNRGDIIVFWLEEEKDYYCKRIVGTPGDEISFYDGYTYINGEKLNETYLIDDVETNCVDTFTVPEDSYFVMGDNRENSYDSRFWDVPYVNKDNICGKLFFIVPLHVFADESP